MVSTYLSTFSHSVSTAHASWLSVWSYFVAGFPKFVSLSFKRSKSVSLVYSNENLAYLPGSGLGSFFMVGQGGGYLDAPRTDVVTMVCEVAKIRCSVVSV